MCEINLTLDLSSSLVKGIYGINENLQGKLITLEVETIPMLLSILRKANNVDFGKINPENNAYIQIGSECYAVGPLARQFMASDSLREPKWSRGVVRTLALLGLIAEKESLPTQFSLNLGILLPYGEISDRENLEKNLRQALKKFKFRDTPYQINLMKFDCKPEGTGVLVKGKTVNIPLNTCHLLVLSLGYRNASYFLYRNGNVYTGETTELGFHWLLNRVNTNFSNLTNEEVLDLLIAYKCCKKNIKKEIVQLELANYLPITKKTKIEVKNVIEVFEEEHQVYWKMLSNWFDTRVFPSVDEVIITGGTSNYLKLELNQYFHNYQISWADHIENIVYKQLIPDEKTEKYRYRLTDILAYYHFFCYNNNKN
jgi:hypothetical protein